MSRQVSLGEEENASTCETCQRHPVGTPSHPVRESRPPEASRASSSVMAARSVDSEGTSRVRAPRKQAKSQEPASSSPRGQRRPTLLAWWGRSCRGLRAGHRHLGGPEARGSAR
jgi:hypothetical protein